MLLIYTYDKTFEVSTMWLQNIVFRLTRKEVLLEQVGMKISIGAGEMTVKGAFNACQNGALKEF